MNNLKWFSFLFFASTSMCFAHKQEIDTIEVMHNNGLRLTLPSSLSFQDTSEGFVIRPHGFENLRSPFKILLTLSTSKPFHDSQWSVKNGLEGSSIYYKINKYPGGSSGTAYILKAWRICQDTYIFLQHDEHIEEVGKPDFTISWEIIEEAIVVNKCDRRFINIEEKIKG